MFENYNFLLSLKEYAYDGALYNLISTNFNFEVWLCHVTKFVFNDFPQKIYIK